MSGTPSSSAARRTRRYRTGSSSLRSSPSTTIAAARVAGRRSWRGAGRARPRPGRPSPSWASTLSVPSTPLAKRAHTYASSLVPRAPPSTAIDAGAVRRRARRRSPSAAASSASRPRRLDELAVLADHRLRGRARRSGPTRSRSGPCRTASRGSPARCRRRAGARAGSTSTRARRGSGPSTSCSTSRPRRGPTGGPGTGTGVAVSAPTGQICTVLPEKYEVNGSSGYVMTSVSPPRPPKSISGSPAISSAKRVQRPHWMQRSRSRSTRSQIGIGFSQCRFSSTKRDSPGPNAASGPAAGTRRRGRTPGSRAGG